MRSLKPDLNRMYCRCGKIHEGEYAAEEYAHHNCFHKEFPLMPLYECQISNIDEDMPIKQVMCVECGEIFDIENIKKENEV